MRNDLMAEEIEIDPVRVAAPFGTAEEPSVEGARRPEIMHREGEVEGDRRGHAHSLAGLASAMTD
jgi:hypothetical protein